MINPCKDCITFAICRTILFPYCVSINEYTLIHAWKTFIEPKCNKLYKVFETMGGTREKLSISKYYTNEMYKLIKESFDLYEYKDIKSK